MLLVSELFVLVLSVAVCEFFFVMWGSLPPTIVPALFGEVGV